MKVGKKRWKLAKVQSIPRVEDMERTYSYRFRVQASNVEVEDVTSGEYCDGGELLILSAPSLTLTSLLCILLPVISISAHDV